jgi:hypothetical protein
MKRIYLDLDGVIFPLTPLDQANVAEEDVEQLHNLEWWRRDVVERLGTMGVEIVLASSWGDEFFSGSIEPSPRRVLQPVRALAITTHLSKTEAIVNDLEASPAQFSWIEDGLTRSMVERVKTATRLRSKGSYIQPNSKTGLTMAEVEVLQQYFSDDR